MDLNSSKNTTSSLKIAFMNIRGQSGLKIDKQLQIESFLKQNHCDILHLQEINIDSDSFSNCD
jgi:exonuclease III